MPSGSKARPTLTSLLARAARPARTPALTSSLVRTARPTKAPARARLAVVACLAAVFLATPLTSPRPSPDEEAFRVGEELHFRIKWSFMTAGYASMAVPERIRYQGAECLVFRSRAQSSGVMKVLFPVDDVITSYWDPVARRVLYSEKRLSEGNYMRTARVMFDAGTNSAAWSEREYSGNTDKLGVQRTDAKWKPRAGTARDLPKDVQDMLSAVYYNRSHPEKGRPGVTFWVNVFDDSKLVKLKMQILRRETIELEVDGTKRSFPALVVRPHITTAGIFKSRGKIHLWISDDHRRWPLLIRAQTPPVGSVTVQLFKTRSASP